MILFWVICVGLVAIALAFILPTLLQGAPAAGDRDKERANVEVYRDQLSELDADLANGIISPEQYQQDRDEIERRLLEDVASPTVAVEKPLPAAALKRGGIVVLVLGCLSLLLPRYFTQFRAINLLEQVQPSVGIILLTLGGLLVLVRTNRAAAYGLALAIPIISVAIYATVGEFRAFQPTTVAAQSNGQMSRQGIEENVAALAKRMEADPGDPNGWAMLGRSYINLEKYNDASNAYAKAVALKKGDADLLIEYAFALAMTNGRKLQGQPTELIKQALQIAPENPKVLQLAGSAEFEAKNYKQAIAYWQKVFEMSSGNPELEQSISKRIDEAKRLAGATAK
jgi:cytochrome c-type biogenesis protein CcmH